MEMMKLKLQLIGLWKLTNKRGEIMKDDDIKTLWEEARVRAKKKYEEECCEDWEEADKYEREDYVFTEYITLVGGK